MAIAFEEDHEVQTSHTTENPRGTTLANNHPFHVIVVTCRNNLQIVTALAVVATNSDIAFHRIVTPFMNASVARPHKCVLSNDAHGFRCGNVFEKVRKFDASINDVGQQPGLILKQ